MLRKKYSGGELSKSRNLYPILTEIQSDFFEEEIKHYTKTIATYSGPARDWIPKGLKILEKMGIISIKEEREGGKFKGKTIILKRDQSLTKRIYDEIFHNN